MNNYKELYLKYKKKYLNLKTKLNMLNAIYTISDIKSKTFKFVVTALTKKKK